MRFTSKLLAGGITLALVAGSACPALADPPAKVTPRASDVVGAGSDTIGYLLDQFSRDYKKANPAAASLLYGWDQVNPSTGAAGDPIATKASCADIARPDGSSAGITALEANTADPSAPADFCIDYAGASRAPAANDPACATGGICFIQFAGNAVTWASRDAASGGTDAPASLTAAQLTKIYSCAVTNWKQVGGQNAPIEAFLPQASSGTRQFFLTAIGLTSPGPCVSDDGGTLQDNQGINPVLDSPEAIAPYSVADYIAQVYHSPACINSSCTGSPACVPTGSQNRFGCDQHGVLGISEIAGLPPMLPWPPPGAPCAQCKINVKFLPAFQGSVSAVVRYAPGTADHIPASIEPFFAASPTGWACTSSTALKDIGHYGFVSLSGGPLIAKSGCGTPYH